MEIQRSEGFTSICIDHSRRVIATESNVSLDGPDGEQTKSISPRNRLSPRSSRPNLSPTDRHSVNEKKRRSVLDTLLLSLFSCVITSLCIANREFQDINPTTQVALFAFCLGNCSRLQTSTWKIYRGEIDPSLNESTRWILFDRTDPPGQNR